MARGEFHRRVQKALETAEAPLRYSGTPSAIQIARAMHQTIAVYGRAMRICAFCSKESAKTRADKPTTIPHVGVYLIQVCARIPQKRYSLRRTQPTLVVC